MLVVDVVCGVALLVVVVVICGVWRVVVVVCGVKLVVEVDIIVAVLVVDVVCGAALLVVVVVQPEDELHVVVCDVMAVCDAVVEVVFNSVVVKVVLVVASRAGDDAATVVLVLGFVSLHMPLGERDVINSVIQSSFPS